MKTWLVYSGYDRGPHALRHRTSSYASAIAYAKRSCTNDRPVCTVRDVLGGLRAEVFLSLADELPGEGFRTGTYTVKETK